jgi:serine/threonine protein kinase/TolB-like protein
MAEPVQEQIFGRYRLLEKLGEGGMAAVYRAVLVGPEGFERQVALKRALRPLALEDHLLKLLILEARLAGRLHHPAIVPVIDVDEVDGEYFLAMEYIDGFDLGRVLARCRDLKRPLPPALAVHIAAELAGALAYAHALPDDDGHPLNVVHRDVSPSNIMLSRLGEVKLTDFGIAKLGNAPRDERTRTGTLKGKIGYMSPEQASGAVVDKRSDIFSLGIVLWECLTLERLFHGGDDLETLRQVREAKVTAPSSVRPEIDPALDAVVLRMLARSAEARYQSCDEVQALLRPFARDADAGALEKLLAELAPPPREADPYDVTTPQKRAASKPRKKRAAPAPASRAQPIAVALVLMAGLAGWAVWSARRPPPVEVKLPPTEDETNAPPPRLPISAPLRLAIVQFKNLGSERDLDVLSEGIGDTLASALGRMRQRIRLIERNQIDKALREIDLGQTKYADKKTAVALGKITGAEMVILGGYQRADGLMRVGVRFVSTESGEVFDSLKLTRPAGPLFQVQDAVTAAVQARLEAMLVTTPVSPSPQ